MAREFSVSMNGTIVTVMMLSKVGLLFSTPTLDYAWLTFCHEVKSECTLTEYVKLLTTSG